VRWKLKQYTQAERLNWSAWLSVSTGKARIPKDLSFIWNQLWLLLEGQLRQKILQIPIRTNPIIFYPQFPKNIWFKKNC